eukprot:6187606-Pleurochrysis_carterae.AAC.4
MKRRSVTVVRRSKGARQKALGSHSNNTPGCEEQPASVKIVLLTQQRHRSEELAKSSGKHLTASACPLGEWPVARQQI